MPMSMNDVKDLLLPGVRAIEVEYFRGGDPDRRKDWDKDVDMDLRVLHVEDCLEISAYDPRSKKTYKERPQEFTRNGINDGKHIERFIPIMKEFANRAKSEFAS